MASNIVRLWTEEEKVGGSGSPYGTFQSCDPTMTYYPAENGRDRGTIIVCPGGGYEMKAGHEGEPIARWLNQMQINAYVLDYRIYPDLHPAPLMDVRRAIVLARQSAESLGTLSDHIGVLGFSAGGHLAASAATMWDQKLNRPDAAVLCYPVISFEKYAHIGSRAKLLGDSANQAMISDLSLENRVDRQTPPTFIWHTADDEVVPVENTIVFAQALASKKVPFSCHIFSSGPHGLGLAEDNKDVHNWLDLCRNFLELQGF